VEEDFAVAEPPARARAVLASAAALLQRRDEPVYTAESLYTGTAPRALPVEVVRLRHRKRPGEPLWVERSHLAARDRRPPAPLNAAPTPFSTPAPAPAPATFLMVSTCAVSPCAPAPAALHRVHFEPFRCRLRGCSMPGLTRARAARRSGAAGAAPGAGVAPTHTLHRVHFEPFLDRREPRRVVRCGRDPVAWWRPARSSIRLFGPKEDDCRPKEDDCRPKEDDFRPREDDSGGLPPAQLSAPRAPPLPWRRGAGVGAARAARAWGISEADWRTKRNVSNRPPRRRRRRRRCSARATAAGSARRPRTPSSPTTPPSTAPRGSASPRPTARPRHAPLIV
jgi:hypothetical protein